MYLSDRAKSAHFLSFADSHASTRLIGVLTHALFTNTVLTQLNTSFSLGDMSSIDTAITISGGVFALAAAIREKPQTVNNWRRRGVPAERCPAIERATNGAVRCEDLRPDIDWAVLRCNCKDAA